MSDYRESTFGQNRTIGLFCEPHLKVWECNPKLSFDEAHQMVASIMDGSADKETITNRILELGAPVWETKQSLTPKKREKRVKAQKPDFQAIYNEAHAAGMAAGEAAVPTPMVVGTPTTPLGNNIDPNKKVYHVPEGPCGFAWVKFKGNTSWGRWAKKNGLTMPGYPNGVQIWVREFGQSVERKSAYASAFAAVLHKHGIECYAGSRLD